MTADPSLCIIHGSRKISNLSPHNEAIALIVAALQQSGVQQLNYDHVQLAVPRSRIELEYKDHRYDIAYLDRHGNRILVEIRTEDRPRP